jgi:hypothetical protein
MIKRKFTPKNVEEIPNSIKYDQEGELFVIFDVVLMTIVV